MSRRFIQSMRPQSEGCEVTTNKMPDDQAVGSSDKALADSWVDSVKSSGGGGLRYEEKEGPQPIASWSSPLSKPRITTATTAPMSTPNDPSILSFRQGIDESLSPFPELSQSKTLPPLTLSVGSSESKADKCTTSEEVENNK